MSGKLPMILGISQGGKNRGEPNRAAPILAYRETDARKRFGKEDHTKVATKLLDTCDTILEVSSD